MIRAAFFACGVFVALCGGALTLVDRVVLTDYAGRKLRGAVETKSSALRLIYSSGENTVAAGREVIDPPDWGGFCLLSVGGVTLLYSLCLPGRETEADEEDE